MMLPGEMVGSTYMYDIVSAARTLGSGSALENGPCAPDSEANGWGKDPEHDHIGLGVVEDEGFVAVFFIVLFGIWRVWKSFLFNENFTFFNSAKFGNLRNPNKNQRQIA